jgi:hypothetical protein
LAGADEQVDDDIVCGLLSLLLVGDAGVAESGQDVRVPGEIVVAFVAELRLYRFWVGERVIPEFLCLLEKHRVTGRTIWYCVQRHIRIAFPEA